MADVGFECHLTISIYNENFITAGSDEQRCSTEFSLFFSKIFKIRRFPFAFSHAPRTFEKVGNVSWASMLLLY